MPQIIVPPAETTFDLESIASEVIAQTMKAGASNAEAVAREGDEFSVNVCISTDGLRPVIDG